MDTGDLIRNMSHHRPPPEKWQEIEELRVCYQGLAKALEAAANPGRAMSIAQTKLEESLMWAVKSIVVPSS